MKNLVYLIFTSIFFFSYFFSNACESQSLPVEKDERVLKLSHNKTGDTVIIQSNDFIQFKYMGKRIKGKIDSIGEKNIYMNDGTYKIDEINALKTEFSKTKFKKRGNTLMIIGALIILAFEIWKYTYIYNNGSVAYHFAHGWKMFGLASAIFLFLPGLIVRIVDFTYRYDLKKRWRIESIMKSDLNKLK